MSLTNINVESIETIDENVNEGILIFRIDTATFNSRLICMNEAGEKKARCTYDSIKATMTIDKLFAMDRDSVRQFVQEKNMGNNLLGERRLNFTNVQSEIFLISYHAFAIEGGLIFQIFIKDVDEGMYVDELTRVERLIDDVEFDEGYIALLVIKNFASMIKSYGHSVMTSINETITEEITEAFGSSVEIGTTDQAYLLIVSEHQNDVAAKLKHAVTSMNHTIFKKGINVLCDIKVGLSTHCNNRYTGLHEAKYSLNEIYYTQVEVGNYVKPSDKMMMAYVIKNDLIFALKRNELSVVFQGIFNIQESYLYGYEVLVRWRHNKYGDISPAQFIPVAEKNELITEIDLWVVEHALRQFEEMEIPGKNKLKLNFNISPRDFYKPDFVDSFISLIENSSIAFNNVILELTETLNLFPKRRSLQKIKDKGIMIALDDFGTGFSSLSQIKHFNIDFLKIDISFVRDINKNYDNTLITNAILALADNLNISVIAEGVETSEQENFLKSRKCEFVQGFKFHKPMALHSIYKSADVEVFPTTVLEHDAFDYKKYVSYYQYGKFIYLSVKKDGSIVSNSDLLRLTLEYDVREGENVKSIVIDGLAEAFVDHLDEVATSGAHHSFMTELVGLKESVPVKVTMVPCNDTTDVDVFIEDYRNQRDDYERMKNIYNRYDLIFKRVNTAIIVYDTNMKIQEWNRQAEVVFGYKRKEVLGKNLIKSLFSEDFHNTMDLLMNKTFAGEETEIVSESHNKAGDHLVCHWQNTRLINDEGTVIGVISWVVDITEKLRVENELSILSTIVQQDPSLIMLTSLDGTIEYVNDAFTKVTGYSLMEAIGQNGGILSCGVQPPEFYEEMFETLLSGKPWDEELRSLKKNGEYYTTLSRIFPIKNEKGNIYRFCWIQKDISKEIEQENMMQEVNETLESQERLSMIGQMAAGIIHEINNPLSSIDINVHALPDMLDGIDKTEQNKEIINELYGLSLDLKDGITGIKNIAVSLKRFTYKSQSNELEEVDLNEEVNTIAIVSKNEYRYYSELLIDAGDIDMVLGDAGKIKQVLLNLIINAVHAIREKGNDFHGQIKIRTYQEGDQVCCDVSDNGSGIPDEIRDKIFESFFTTKKIGKGTGLGLSLSKKIIEAEHKGTLTFVSEVGAGSTFSIRLSKSVATA